MLWVTESSMAAADIAVKGPEAALVELKLLQDDSAFSAET